MELRVGSQKHPQGLNERDKAVTYWDLIGSKGLLTTSRLRSMSCTFFSSMAKLNCISAMSRRVGVFICLFLKVV